MKLIYKPISILLFCMSFLISFSAIAQDDEVIDIEEIEEGITWLPVDNVKFFIMEGNTPIEVDLTYFKEKWEAEIVEEEGEEMSIVTFMIMKRELDAEETTYMIKGMTSDGLMEMGEFLQPQRSMKNPEAIPENAYLVID